MKFYSADPRFSSIQTDPRFRLPSKWNTHVQIDKRFAHMLRDERFSSRAKVDRYGRKLAKGSGRKELERFYRVEDVEQDENSEEEIEIDDDEEVEKELRRMEGQGRPDYDPARSGGFDESSSDETSSEEADVEVEEEEVFGFADQHGEDGNGVQAGEVSSRIAVVNLDWDNIRAFDLMAVFESFVPAGSGRIVRVDVFPSEFGKERMEREEMEGPPKEIFVKNAVQEQESDVHAFSSEEEEEGEEGDGEEEDDKIRKSLLKEDQGEEFDSARLRRYQLERLRYYYAVLTCSSKAVAEAIYNAVDGTEYLTTANFFDLRFVPEGMDFSDDKPRDVCERIPNGYRPNEFVTDALQHSKVRLTWDAEDNARKEVQKRAFSGSRADIDANDLKAYLGSDTSSEGEAPEPIVVDSTQDTSTVIHDLATHKSPNPKFSKKEEDRQRMRALFGLGAEPAPSKKSGSGSTAPIGDMQITFASGLTANNKGSVFENEPEPKETTVEKYVRKEKERKARRKEKMKAVRNGTEEATPGNGEEDEAERGDLGFDDPFFTAPTDDKVAATAARKEQMRLKKSERAAADASASAQRAELELLMVDDDASNADKRATTQSKVNHFDINEIAKAEKALMKKGKKLSTREKAALETKAKDEFKMDVSDPRFSAVFEQSEFAVDPSNPRFKGTEGMKALLEEGRRKRTRDGDVGEDSEGRKSKKDKGGSNGAVGKGKEDLKKLVDRVRGKTATVRRN